MPITLSFHGAARTVTGSCYLLEVGQSRILIDCGLFQGSRTIRALNEEPFPFEPGAIDALLLTHAHIDHTGLVPKLVRDGFRRTIFATAPTGDLLACMLPDSAQIQESDAENQSRRNRRRGLPAVQPLYRLEHAEKALERIEPVALERWIDVAHGIRARWWNAGHLIGSASIEIEAGHEGEHLRLLFSGDLGPDSKLLQFEPEAPAGFDYVICESTYGDRDRIDITDAARLESLAEACRPPSTPADHC